MTKGSGGIHHLDLSVSDLERSTAFYDRILSRLGFRRFPDCAEGPLWAGASFELGLQAARAGEKGPHDRFRIGLHHLAFGAASREAVDEFHRALVAWGIPILDPPADYPEYGPGYYAVFFLDPDGIKLELAHTTTWPA